MSKEFSSYCWVRIVEAKVDPIDPEERGLVETFVPLGEGDPQGEDIFRFFSWGRPDSMAVASWSPGTAMAGNTGKRESTPIAWMLASPRLGSGSPDVTFDFGPAFEKPAEARTWIETPTGQAWARQSLRYHLLYCGTKKGGAPHQLVGDPCDPESVEEPGYQNANCTKPEYLFSNHWWGRGFLKIHERVRTTSLLDFDALLALTLPGAEFTQTPKEITDLLELQRARTQHQADRCISQSQGSDALIWPLLESSNLPLDKLRSVPGQMLIEHLMEDIETAIFQQKRKYMRKRPAEFDHRVTPLLKGPSSKAGDHTGRLYPGHPSFPSGHATMAQAWSKLIAHLSADGPTTDALAREMAFNREVAGVHYRSDSVAGELLAEAIVEQIFEEDGKASQWLTDFKEFTSR